MVTGLLENVRSLRAERKREIHHSYSFSDQSCISVGRVAHPAVLRPILPALRPLFTVIVDVVHHRNIGIFFDSFSSG